MSNGTRELAWFKSSYSGSSGDDCIEVALDWRKSSYSGDSSGDCVEVANDWRKSSYSGDDSGDCVEICPCPSTIHVRDSKNPRGPQLALAPQAWGEFIKHTAHR